MKSIALALAAAAIVISPLPAGVAKAQIVQLAQADVEIGVRPRERPDVVIEERRRPGVVIESEGRRLRDCRTVTVEEWRHGERVMKTIRRCD